ncbi:hypothetical protein ES703_37353 [subsurface metagenome]
MFTLDPPISCSKVRLYAASYHDLEWLDPDFDIDYYDGAWHNIWSGLISKNTWVEIEIPGTPLITGVRVKRNEIYITELYEFNFWSEG